MQFCGKGGGYCNLQANEYYNQYPSCTQNSDCSTGPREVKAKCCSSLKAEYDMFCQLPSNTSDALVAASRGVGQCADTDCSGWPSTVNGATTVTHFSVLLHLVVSFGMMTVMSCMQS